MLIDGPSLVYRGYFALPPLTTSDGTLVNAAFGFLQIVLRGMQDLKPDYAIVTFDLGKPQFRFTAYPAYKAGRPSMPDDLRAQFPVVRDLCQMMGMPIRELSGYEADDVIGSLAQRATAADVDTMIVSGDLDGLQLVNDHVRLLTTRMGVAATVIYDIGKVNERYGLRPDQMLDYKALAASGSLHNTPPAFAIYMVGLVFQWIKKNGGLQGIARTNRSKADLIYNTIDQSGGFYRGHAQPEARSVMNIPFRLPSEELEATFASESKKCGLIGLKGHRSVGGMRASIYNAMTLEGCQELANFMKDFQKKNG